MEYWICCIVKNEHRFIKEWVDYHLGVGFNKIYIFEDYDSKSHKDIFIDYPNVNVMPIAEYGIKNYRTSYTQMQLYSKFLREVREKDLCDWVLFTDIDEFIMFEQGYNLDKLCEEYKDIPAIWLSWKMYGANGHIKRPNGGVLENYTSISQGRCDCDERWNFKSLVNVSLCNTFVTIHAALGGEHTNGDKDMYGPQCYNKAWINHYYTKSWEDYVDRMCSRGNMSNNYRTFDQFFTVNPDMLPQKMELINSVRYLHTVSTHWISKELGIISGGNLHRIQELKKKYKL